MCLLVVYACLREYGRCECVYSSCTRAFVNSIVVNVSTRRVRVPSYTLCTCAFVNTVVVNVSTRCVRVPS